MKSEYPIVLTVDEVASILRVPRETVTDELNKGNIPGFKVGTEWRILQEKLFNFMEAEMDTETTNSVTESTMDVKWQKADPFKYKWPDGTVETYDEAYEADLNLPDCSKAQIGYTTRNTAGMTNRCRVVVFMKFGSQIVPVVEFAGANDFDATGLVASVIKNDDNKHVQSISQLPSEYSGFPVKVYSEVVVGPYASNGLAVVVDKDDRRRMLHHAFIRASYKGWIK